MRSDEQIEASRANGRKSNGPVTPEGKENSSRNATKAGLSSSSNVYVLAGEDSAVFKAFHDEFCERFQPADTVEHDLVFKMVAASWRERRILAIETSMLEINMARTDKIVERDFGDMDMPGRRAMAFIGSGDAGKSFALLLRYAATARRSYDSALRSLRELQGDRFQGRSSSSKQASSRKSSPSAFVENESKHVEQSPDPGEVVSQAQPSVEPKVSAQTAHSKHQSASGDPVIHSRPSEYSDDTEATHAEHAKLPNEPGKPAAAMPLSFVDDVAISCTNAA